MGPRLTGRGTHRQARTPPCKIRRIDTVCVLLAPRPIMSDTHTPRPSPLKSTGMIYAISHFMCKVPLRVSCRVEHVDFAVSI